MIDPVTSIKALNEAGLDRIAARVEDNRNGRGRLLGCTSGGIAAGCNQDDDPLLH